VVVDRVLIVGEAFMNGGEGVQDVGLDAALTRVASQGRGAVGEFQGLGVAAGVAVDLGEDADGVRFVAGLRLTSR